MIEFIDKVQPLFDPYRYKVLYGGRASLKSWSIARALLILSCKRPLRILCTREFQNSIKESVFKLLEDQIDRLGLTAYFKITNTEITNKFGSQFIFTGLHNNVTKIKSMEGVDIVWVEESESVSEYSWSILIPTIRKPGSEIWISFNPFQEDDPTYKRFVTNTPPNTFVQRLSWEDNPWLSEEVLAEKDYLKSVDYDSYLYVWMGEFLKRSKAQIFYDKVRIEEVKPKQDWHGPYYGLDWGFSQDPTRLTKVWIHDRRLYIQKEVDAIKVDIDKLPQVLLKGDPECNKYAIRADNARPESISYVKQHGFPQMVPCTKGKGSIEEGITFIRSFEEIIIDPSCTKTIEESKLYKYKTDKLTGEVLPEIVSGFDHSWDSIRYSLEPIMKNKQSRQFDMY